jgi:hypothetical protein
MQFMHRYYAHATRENRQTEKLTQAARGRRKELDFYRLSDFDRRDCTTTKSRSGLFRSGFFVLGVRLIS